MMKALWTALVALALFGLFAGLGALAWFECAPPTKTCASCHEIRGARDGWAHGAHTNVSCKACHGGTLSSFAAVGDNLRRAWRHVTATNHPALRRDLPLGEAQVERMSAACGRCHQQEYAGWARSGHAAPVAKFLLDEHHNRAWKPADQCLRCHGMFLDGDVETILARVPAEGRFARVQTAEELPRVWRFRDPAQGRRAAVPCLACHRGHPLRGGDPFAKTRAQGPVAFYSRPEQLYFEPSQLFLQKIVQDGKPVPQAFDPRRRLCQQCHAANAFGEAGSSDDRTPTGAHAGFSCIACHGAHGADPRRSCGTCHVKCRWPEGVESPIHNRPKSVSKGKK